MAVTSHAEPLPEEVVNKRIQNHPCGIKSLQDEFIDMFKLTMPESRGGIDTYILGVKPAVPLLYRNPAVPNLRGEIDESALLDSETYFCEFEATRLSVNPTNNRSRSKSIVYIYVVALDNPETMIWRVVNSRGEAASLAERLPSHIESEESCHGKKFKSKYENTRYDQIGDSFGRRLNDMYGHNIAPWDYEDTFSSYEERAAYFVHLAEESMEFRFNNVYVKEFFYPTQSHLCVIDLTRVIDIALLTSKDVLTILDNPARRRSLEPSKGYNDEIVQVFWSLAGVGQYDLFSGSDFKRQKGYPKRMVTSVRLR